MTDVFDQSKPEGTAENQSGEAGGDTLNQLVGEGKKFATVEDLARGKLESDNFIETLKGEQKEMRDHLAKLEERLAKVQTVGDVLSEQSSTPQEGNQSPAVSTDELLKLVDQRLNEKTNEQTAKANRAKANAAVLKHLNDDSAKAREFIAREAERLNMSPAQLADISAQSPDAFLRMVGINQPKQPNAGVRFDPAVNPDSNPAEGAERDHAYYSKLRKELGHRFYEADIQQQRMRDRQRLGDRYFK